MSRFDHDHSRGLEHEVVNVIDKCLEILIAMNYCFFYFYSLDMIVDTFWIS